jgi:hypothetical protein
MASSSSSGSREDIDVDAAAVPFKLRERLGPEATGGLLHVLEVAQHEGRDDVLNLAAERFERRLAEVGSGLRVQIAHSEAALRHEMAQFEVRLREGLGDVDVRLRQDLSQMELRIIREIGDNRFHLLKWTFAFWIGQVVAMSAIVAAMLRVVR